MSSCIAGAGVAAMSLLCAPALAVSSPFTEDFTDGTNRGWGGGAFVSSPVTGGVGGAGDGFLRIATEEDAFLGSRNRGIEYAGDYIAAGVTTIKLWLADIEGDQELDVHLAIGRRTNLWLFNEGFAPTAEWSEFTVDLTDKSLWTQIAGGDAGLTFTDALSSADRMLIRHDPAPFAPVAMGPDLITGEVGVDRIQFIPAPGSALPLIGLALVLARRRK